MQLEPSTKIIAHHIGGRGLTVAFFIPPAFSGDIVNVLYEADADAVANAADDVAAREDFYLLPYGLGDEEGPATLYVTQNAYGSSLYKPNAAYNDYSLEVELSGALDGVSVDKARYDARMGAENEIVEEVEIQLKTLDSLVAQGLVPAGTERPDVLSLDTQGYEHAILLGAEKTVCDSVLAIATEISFHPIYEGQPLFGDIQTFLHERGMHFAGFYDLYDITPNQTPITMRARGFTGFGDAVFLRRLDTLRDIAPTDAEFHLAARKLAFIAINFGYFEYGLEALTLSANVDPGAEMSAAMSKRSYVAFTGALFDVMLRQQGYLLTDRQDVVEFCRRLEEIDLTFRAARHPAPVLTGHEQNDDRYLIQSYYQQNAPTDTVSDVETLLNSYGYTELAALVQKRRHKARGYAALPTLRLVTVALNDDDMTTLLDASLPTLLAPGNLPNLTENFNCEIAIVATEALHTHASNAPVFKELRRHVHIHCIHADDLELADFDTARTPAWVRGVADMGNDGIENWLMFFTPNTVFADGSFANAMDYLTDGKTRLVMAPLYECMVTPVRNHIRNMQDGNAPIASLTHRQLANMTLKNLPMSILSGMVSDKTLSSDATNGYFWRVGEEALVARQMRLGVAFVKPTLPFKTMEALWDEGVLSEICPELDPVVLADSDQFLAVDLVEQNSGVSNPTGTWPSDTEIARRLQPLATRDRRLRSATSTVLHTGDLTDQIQKAHLELNGFMDSVNALIGDAPTPHIKTEAWRAAMESCSAAAEDYWRDERRRLSPIRDMPPSNELLSLYQQRTTTYPSHGVAAVKIATDSLPPANIGATIMGVNYIPNDPENVLQFTLTVNGYSTVGNTLVALLLIDGEVVKHDVKEIEAGEYTALKLEFWMTQNPGRRLALEAKVGVASEGEIYLNGNESGIISSDHESGLKIQEYRRCL